METFAERLHKLMSDVGLTQSNMAKLLDVSEQRVENLLIGYGEADDNILSRLAQIFSVSKAYISMQTDIPTICEPDYAKEVFVAESLRIGDGVITQSSIVDTVFVNRDQMHGKEYYGLVAKDDSLAKARIYKGDIMIIRKQNSASNGDIVVAMVGDEPEVVRRYHRLGNKVTLSPECDNERYKTLEVDTENEKFLILGKVCEVRIKDF